MGRAFYRGSDCCALVFDLTRKDSLEHLKRWRDGFVENGGHEDVSDFPFLVMGNKCDKTGDRQVSEEAAK